MRTLLVVVLFFLIACGQSSTGNKISETDSNGLEGSIAAKESGDTLYVNTPTIPWQGAINDLLKAQGMGQWHVVTDPETGWTKDVFDYFVAPERKKNPEYPFIARGDFDCDGKPDVAALVKDSTRASFKLLLLLEDWKKLSWWKEDVEGAAIGTLTDKEVAGFEDLEKEKKVKLNCQAVELVWYEKSSYVVYWDGKKFDRVWTSD